MTMLIAALPLARYPHAHAPLQGEYAPADLLCPHTWRWAPLDVAGPLLDGDKYAILDADARADPSIIEDIKKRRLAAAAAAIRYVPLALRERSAEALAVAGDLVPQGQRMAKEALLQLAERVSPELFRRIVVRF